MSTSHTVDAPAVPVAKGGRPRLDGLPAHSGHRSPRIDVAIPESLYAQLTERAVAAGITRSDLVREALTAYFSA